MLTEENKIYENIMNDKKIKYIKGIYGDGKASEEIISILCS